MRQLAPGVERALAFGCALACGVVLTLPTARLAVAAPSAGRAAQVQVQARDSTHAGGLLFLHDARQAGLARDLGEAMLEASPLPALPPDVQARNADPPIRIWLAPDEATFSALAGGAAPEWGAGIARSDPELIILPVYATDRIRPSELPRVLRHELAHIALERELHGLRVPRWFHEGYARWVAGELDPEGALRIRLAFATGSAPPLDSITLGWPSGEIDARLAYLLSTSAIQYLWEEAGERGLRIMLQRWRESGDMDTAMRDTYGVTVAQFEEDWREFVKRRYGWAAALGHAALFWAVMAVLLVLLVVRRRRQDRAKLARLRATEPPDQPAFWNQPPETPPPEDEPRG